MIALSDRYIAVLDTCVLAPMPLCDTLLRLAEDPALYSPRWTDAILGELRSTLLRMGYTEAQATRRITAMETAFEDAKVTGHDCLVASMTNHPKDRHVLAAAVRCGAHAIVTANLKHFPENCLQPYDISALTPDDFLVHQWRLDSDLVMERLLQQATVLRGSVPGLLLRLSKHARHFANLAQRLW